MYDFGIFSLVNFLSNFQYFATMAFFQVVDRLPPGYFLPLSALSGANQVARLIMSRTKLDSPLASWHFLKINLSLEASSTYGAEGQKWDPWFQKPYSVYTRRSAQFHPFHGWVTKFILSLYGSDLVRLSGTKTAHPRRSITGRFRGIWTITHFFAIHRLWIIDYSETKFVMRKWRDNCNNDFCDEKVEILEYLMICPNFWVR